MSLHSSSSSFVRKGASRQHEDIILKGIKKISKNGSLDIPTVSTGIPSLDKYIFDGIPIGRLVAFKEDEPNSVANYSSILLKCFLAEGVENGNVCIYIDFVGEEDAEAMLAQLPSKRENETREPFTPENMTAIDAEKIKMKIAWRYERYKANIDTGGSSKMLYSFDLGKKSGRGKSIYNISFVDPKIFELIQHHAQECKKSRNVLRIGIRSIGNPMNNSKSVFQTIQFLKRLQVSFAENIVILLTLPSCSTKFEANVNNLEYWMDGIYELQTCALDEYSGLLHIRKPMIQPKSLALVLPENSSTIAFKIKRRELVFETFHLPPDLQNLEVDDAGTDEKSLEF